MHVCIRTCLCIYYILFKLTRFRHFLVTSLYLWCDSLHFILIFLHPSLIPFFSSFPSHFSGCHHPHFLCFLSSVALTLPSSITLFLHECSKERTCFSFSLLSFIFSKIMFLSAFTISLSFWSNEIYYSFSFGFLICLYYHVFLLTLTLHKS